MQGAKHRQDAPRPATWILVRCCSAGAGAGLLVGLLLAARSILQNDYLDLGLFRLALLEVRDQVDLTVAISLAAGAVGALYWLVLVRGLGMRRGLVAGVGFCLALIALGIGLNHEVFVYQVLPALGGSISFEELLGPVLQRLDRIGLALAVLGVIAVGVVVLLRSLRGKAGVAALLARFAPLASPRVLLAVVVVLLLVNGAVLVDGRVNRPQGPSVVLISIDTLRADHLGCYSPGRSNTPNIDRFAEKTTRFQNAITPRSKTTPSMVSMLTGLYPHSHGVRRLWQPASRRCTTLAELLRNANYRTGAFVGNWVLRRSVSGLEQGFDTFNDTLEDRELHRRQYEKKAPRINTEAIRWCRENGDRPFFLWVHYQDVHGPYIAPKDYYSRGDSPEDLVPEHVVPEYQRLPWVASKDGKVDAEVYRRAYEAEIRYCDEAIGELLDRLEEIGGDEMIVVLTADHGESLGEHDYYFEHGDDLYDPCARVPLLIRLPGAGENRVIEEQVGVHDLHPTILEALGMKSPVPFEGISLLPAIREGRAPEDRRIFIEKENLAKAVRTNRWKYILDLQTGKDELYDLQGDPGETTNVAGHHPDVVAELRNDLAGWMTEADALDLQSLEEAVTHAADVEILRALGYLKE